jgi:uncharacterized protein
MTDLSHLARPGATLAIRVTPNARRAGMELVDGQIRIAVTETPEAGKATEAARAALAKALGVAKTRLTLSAARLRGTSFSDWTISSGGLPLQPVAAFRQVQRGGEVAKLGRRQGDAQHLVRLGIDLLDRDAILEGVDHDVFQKRAILALVDQGDDRRVEFVLDGEHGIRLAPRVTRRNPA